MPSVVELRKTKIKNHMYGIAFLTLTSINWKTKMYLQFPRLVMTGPQQAKRASEDLCFSLTF